MREVSTLPGFTIGFILMEYFGSGKIASVPPSTTAFRHATTTNINLITLWNQNKADNENVARRYVDKVVDILERDQPEMLLSESLGYAHYGMLS